MSARALLDRLTAAGLSVAAQDGKLLIWPAERFTDALRAEVVAVKPELLAHLLDTAVDTAASKAGSIKGVEVPADRRARALQRQRQRRATRTRIDFYPSTEAMSVIDLLRHPSSGGDASSIINRALIEWGASGILSAPKRRSASRAPG